MKKYKEITKEESINILKNWKSDKIKVEIIEENIPKNDDFIGGNKMMTKEQREACWQHTNRNCENCNECNLEKIDWFDKITERLRDYSEGDIWTSGDEILVKTESAADAIADMLETLYKTQGEEILVNTGYYDPEEDKRNNEVDRYTGWWYVNIQ